MSIKIQLHEHILNQLYNLEKFNVQSLRKLFLKKIPETKVLNEHPDGTLQLNISGVDVSIFYHPYPLIGKLVEFQPVKLASLEDISASKIAAVVQRAKQRESNFSTPALVGTMSKTS